MKKNRSMICGTKLKTAETPPNTPSRRNEVYQASGMTLARFSMIRESVNQPNQDWRNTPSDGIPSTGSPDMPEKKSAAAPSIWTGMKKRASPKVKWKTRNMMKTKIGRLQILWVKTLSIFSEVVNCLSFVLIPAAFSFETKAPMK